VFGAPPLEDVPIPQAVAASSAIPLFFEPVRIGDADFVDGSVGRVGHVDLLIDRGATRIVVVNPVVPIRNDRTRVCLPDNHGGCMTIRERGLFAVWKQSSRITSRMRLHLGLSQLAAANPRVRIVVIEPSPDEAQLFLQPFMGLRGLQDVLAYARAEAAAKIGAALSFLQEEGSPSGPATARECMVAPVRATSTA